MKFRKKSGIAQNQEKSGIIRKIRKCLTDCSYGDDFTITDEGLQILIYTRHSWPLISEGSLSCLTFCDTGHHFIWSSPKTCDARYCYKAFNSKTVTTCLNILGISQPGLELPITLHMSCNCFYIYESHDIERST